jgi:hypothetical protein
MSRAAEYQEARVRADRGRAFAAPEENLIEVLLLHTTVAPGPTRAAARSARIF